MSRWILFLVAASAVWGCSSPSPVDKDLTRTDGPVEVGIVEDVAEVRFATDLRVKDVGPEVFVDAADVGIADVPLLACDPGEGCFMDQCEENGDCQSSWCVEHLGEKVCTQTCQEECPNGWSCQQVSGAVPDLVFVCVSDFPNLCRPCSQAMDCVGVGGTEDACVAYGEQGSFCGGKCGEAGECPWGFKCDEVTTVDGVELDQCVAETGACHCTETSVVLGLFTVCQVSNEFGVCEGKRVCVEEGLTDCDASIPDAETCNGVDDNCDGDIDEPTLVEGDFVNLCDDGNECTEDKCSGESGCTNDVLESGPCEDGDPCTVADHCEDGTCLADPVECEDDNPCTDNVCTETGGCEYPPNSAACDDDDACTVADQCSDGVCTGTPVPCDCKDDEDCGELEDGDMCNGTLLCDTAQYPYKCVVSLETVVSCPEPEGDNAFCLQSHCEAATGECSLVPHHDAFLCDNADACSVNTACFEGVCTGGDLVNCNDGNPCTDDSCDVEVGCVHANNIAACNDGDVCTTLDTCSDGECSGGSALDCDDGDVCNGVETCDPQSGCKSALALECNDNNPCNGIETCDPVDGCQLGEALNCDDGNLCTEDSCDAQMGCTNAALTGPECDDDNACNELDLCQDGLCVGSGVVDCSDDNPCTDTICDPEAGCVTTLNDALCDDGDICSTGDYCNLGDCTSGGELPCDDGNVCTDDSCDSNIGCQFIPNQSECDDGDACTEFDVCAAGWCIAGPGLDCDDKNDCTENTCDGDLGCVTTLVEEGTGCGDSDQWQCVQGECSCIPDCEGRNCGSDGCEGICGECEGEDFCSKSKCMLPLALPDSGMSSCYNSVGTIPCPAPGEAYYGQDRTYQTTPLGYVDNGDGTATDLVTGLVWAICNAGKTGDNCLGDDAVLSYAAAKAYCEENQDGHPGEGWRMPNLDELTSIVHFQGSGYKSSPPFGGTKYYAFWATPVGVVDETHCFVSFATGQTACGWLDPEVGQRFRCVRGFERSAGDFVDNNDGTVTDQATSLIWLKEPLGSATWSSALADCESLDFAGAENWRLPNAREIATLRDYVEPHKGMYEQFFDGPEATYWSSTTFQGSQYQGSAYALHPNGTVGLFSDSKYGGHQVRCVRQDCTPDCAGKQCGDDGCGGICGKCPDGFGCNLGSCTQTGAVWFDGQHQILADVGLKGAKTYSLWFYLEDVEPTQTLLIKKDTPGNPTGFRPVNIVVWQGHLTARMMYEGSGGSQEIATTEVQASTWHHVAWQVSSDLAQLYIDGALAGEKELPGGNIDSDLDYTVGGAPVISDFGNYVTGYIYNLRIMPGLLYDGNFASCSVDVLDDESYLIYGNGPFPCDCKPACAGKVCGTNGCGGDCGVCLGPQDECVAGQCECQPDCEGKQCGDDGCGGICGECDGPQDLCVAGQCECQPACDDKECGDDGCDGACGQCPGLQDVCLIGQCVCLPSCGGKECGDDGCGGTCGSCEENHVCVIDGTCLCIPSCDGKDCGDNGCGGSCGDCEEGYGCNAGKCAIYDPYWTDPSSGLMWQNPPTNFVEWQPIAKSHCANLGLGGYGDWRLPTIGELRTLIRGCPAAGLGGSCNVEDGICLSYVCRNDSCDGCSMNEGPADGCYWPDVMQGECSSYWSSSPAGPCWPGTSCAWSVYFAPAVVSGSSDIISKKYIRCVR